MGLLVHKYFDRIILFMSEVAIEIKNITKSFGMQEVHKNISLSMIKGKTTVIVGKSGVGKSVLIKYILGLLKPDSGEILIEGQEMTHFSRKQLYHLRSRFGVLFQSAALFDSMDVFDNVALPLREKTKLKENEIRSKVIEKLNWVGIKEESLYKYPSEISGGMQKRVGLARALQRDPEIVLFDEPTTGLDPETSESIYDLFKELQEKLNYTAIIVSHDIPRVFRIADQVAILEDGEIKACMKPEEFKSSDNPWVIKMLQSMEF